MEEEDRITRRRALQAEFEAICKRIVIATPDEKKSLLAEGKRVSDALLANMEEQYGPLPKARRPNRNPS